MKKEIWTVERTLDDDNYPDSVTVSIHRTKEGAQKECDKLTARYPDEEFFVIKDELKD